jgi:hypothetical protein
MTWDWNFPEPSWVSFEEAFRTGLLDDAPGDENILKLKLKVRVRTKVQTQNPEIPAGSLGSIYCFYPGVGYMNLDFPDLSIKATTFYMANYPRDLGYDRNLMSYGKVVENLEFRLEDK